jgi:RNA 3'-terminal phosphate cyclase
MTRPGFEPGPSRLEAGDYFFYLVCEAVGTAATPGLLCQPLVIMKMIVEKQIKCTLAGETEVLGENLPQRHLLSIT